METLRGIVTRILSPKPPEEVAGNVFFTLEYETPKGLVSGKVGSRAWGLQVGDCISGEGTWDDSKLYMGKPDPVFKSRQVRPDLPQTAHGAELFLRSMFNEHEHGVLPSRIREVLAQKGAEFLRMSVAKPDTMLQMTSNQDSFGKAVLEEWSRRTQGGQAIALMERSGLPARAISRIVAELRGSPLRLLEENPYRVAGLLDVGFDNADKIGRHLGFASDHNQRLTAAVNEVLRKQEEQGSTAADLDTLLANLSSVSQINKNLLLEFLRDAARRTDNGLAIYTTQDGQPAVAALLKLYIAEIDISSGVRLLLAGRRNAAASMHAAALVLFSSNAKFSKFDRVQRTAVEMAACEPLCILTGGPGTGKSTVMESVAQMCDKLDKGSLFLAAPTGKAAKRLQEATGRKSSTLHRLLKAKGGKTGTEFGYNRHNRLPGECVVVVDEASMMDSVTCAALFNAMPPNGRLILVGDKNQLPSVGAGSVLADLLHAEVDGHRLVQSVELVNVYRQTKDSGIAKGAALIKDGIVPQLSRQDSSGVSFLEMDTLESTRVVDEIEHLVCTELPALGYDSIKDIAVLCPMAPGLAGTWQINARLSARLNPGGQPLPGVAMGHHDNELIPVPRSGDRVMLTENDADNDVMNGDVGTILGPGQNGAGRPTIRVAFDSGPEVEISAAKWRTLILAYAGTIHKSQGSQYEVVIMPVMAHAKMLERPLLYTGWSRAKSKLVLLGDKSALAKGIANCGTPRSTMLKRFLASLQVERAHGNGQEDWHSIALAAQATLDKERDTTRAGTNPPTKPALPQASSLFGGLFAATPRAASPRIADLEENNGLPQLRREQDANQNQTLDSSQEKPRRNPLSRPWKLSQLVQPVESRQHPDKKPGIGEPQDRQPVKPATNSFFTRVKSRVSQPLLEQGNAEHIQDKPGSHHRPGTSGLPAWIRPSRDSNALAETNPRTETQQSFLLPQEKTGSAASKAAQATPGPSAKPAGSSSMSRSVSALFGARPRIALNTTEPTQPLETKNINETANETASDKKTGVQSQMFFAPSGSKRFVPDEIHDDFYSDDFHSDDDLHGDDDNEQSPVFGS